MKMFMDNNKEYLEDLLVRMAHHSTAIEGNSLTQGETKSIILENYIPRPIDIREVNEVLNYKNLLPYLLEHQKENITISGIQDINRIIMKNIDDRGGKFKIVQNIIAGADFDTTMPFMVPEELKKWTDDLSWRLNHAEKNQDKRFYIAYTYEGFNLNGYTGDEMFEMFTYHNIPNNIIFNDTFEIKFNEIELEI